MDIVGKRRIFLGISAILVALSIVVLFAPGLRLGIDFVAGTSITYEFTDADPGTAEVRAALIEAGQDTVVVQNLGGGEYFVRTNELGEGDKERLDDALEQLTGAPPITLDLTTVGRSVADDTVQNAITAVVVASIFVMLYIMYAFRAVPNSFRYAVAAVVALLHDVLIALGVFVVLGVAINAEVNAIFIVGILTVIGYSVNDTIVVFDRIRENVTLAPGRPFRSTVNLSINETIVRSLATSITTMIVILAMLLFGGASLRDFLLVLLTGVAVGTYSSIFIAAQILVAWESGELSRFMPRRPRRATAESA
ncbi:MAG: protein translocase subunit SecF [Dehalococcoidia bacterium]